MIFEYIIITIEQRKKNLHASSVLMKIFWNSSEYLKKKKRNMDEIEL